VLLPFSNDSVHQSVDSAHPPRIADVARYWNSIRNAEWKAEPNGYLVRDRIKSLTDFGDLTVDLGIKQCLGCDRQRQGHHVCVNVPQLTRLPMVKHTFGQSHYRFTVASESAIVEGWRHQTSLTVPDLPLARQKTLPENRLHMTKEERKLDEVAMVLDQHMLNVFGVVDENRRPSGKAQGYDIAVLARPFIIVA
jgi:hypothetical protein